MLRAALAFAVFALIAGAGAIRPIFDDLSMTALGEQAVAEPVLRSDASSKARPRPLPGESVMPRKSDALKSEGGKMCEETTWAYLVGKCASSKARKPRFVRVPTNRPAIALIPIGRRGAAPADEARSTAVAERVPKSEKNAVAASTSSQSAAAAAVSSQKSDPALQAFAASKKPQRTAQNRNQRRNRSWRDEGRADRWGWGGRRGYAEARGGGREGFSGWSW